MSIPVGPQVVVSVSVTEMAANFTGTYSATAVYSVGQWVAYEEGLYACIQAVTGKTPAAGSAYWRVIGGIPKTA
jgi:hypothetical protein